MSGRQSYGVLRIVGGNYGGHRQIAKATVTKKGMSPTNQMPSVSGRNAWSRHRDLKRWFPEERLMHVLWQRETTIGRSLSSNIIVLDPSISRDHARLVKGEQGWSIHNVTEKNVVRVNGRCVEGGTYASIQPQDLLVIGNITLQLVAPLLDKDIRMSLDGQSQESLAMQSGTSCISSGLSATDGKVVSDRTLFFTDILFPLTLPSEMTRDDEPIVLSTYPDLPNLQEKRNLLRPGVITQFISTWLGIHGARRIFLIGGLLLVVLIVCALFVVNNLRSLSQYSTMNVVMALTAPLIPALGINLLVHFMDRFERESWFLRLAAFLWGAVIAIPLALFVEHFIDGFLTNLWNLDSQIALHAFLSGLDAGITEETVKGLGLLLLFFLIRNRFDNITDGIVYGALIGAGFAMVENFFYFLNGTSDIPTLIIGRIVLGWLSHSTFMICFGAALGYVRHTRVRWRHIVVPILGYLLAVGLHTIFDFINVFVRDMVPTYGNGSTIAHFAIFAIIGNDIFLFIVQICILYVLIRSLMHEATIIRDFLTSEVANGIVTVEEYALLPHPATRTRLERRVLWSCGFKQWRLMRALYQSEISLAFYKWHMSMGDKPKLGYLQPEVTYHKRIQRIRQELATCPRQKRNSAT